MFVLQQDPTSCKFPAMIPPATCPLFTPDEHFTVLQRGAPISLAAEQQQGVQQSLFTPDTTAARQTKRETVTEKNVTIKAARMEGRPAGGQGLSDLEGGSVQKSGRQTGGRVKAERTCSPYLQIKVSTFLVVPGALFLSWGKRE